MEVGQRFGKTRMRGSHPEHSLALDGVDLIDDFIHHPRKFKNGRLQPQVGFLDRSDCFVGTAQSRLGGGAAAAQIERKFGGAT